MAEGGRGLSLIVWKEGVEHNSGGREGSELNSVEGGG